MKTNQFNVGKDYSYGQIESFANHFNFELEEHGNDLIGEGLLIVRDTYHDQIKTFLFTGYAGAGIAYYTCVYSDKSFNQ
jgi:hypothetical protein